MKSVKAKNASGPIPNCKPGQGRDIITEFYFPRRAKSHDVVKSETHATPAHSVTKVKATDDDDSPDPNKRAIEQDGIVFDDDVFQQALESNFFVIMLITFLSELDEKMFGYSDSTCGIV